MKKIIISGLFLVMFIMGAFALSQKRSNSNTEFNDKLVVELSDNEFKALIGDYNAKAWTLKSPTPVIIDFYAPWCGPCKKLAPILEDVAKNYRGKIAVYKINVDNHKEIAHKFNVRSLPTLAYLSKDGKITYTQGLIPQSTIENYIESHLLK